MLLHLITLVILLGLCFYIFFSWGKRKTFPVRVDPPQMKILGINIFPLMTKILRLLPDHMRKQSVIKKSAPDPNSPMLDLFSCKGENPYQIEEVLSDTVWRVGYSMENFMFTRPKSREMFKMLGLDFMKEEFKEKVLMAAKEYGEEVVNLVKNDIKIAKYWSKKKTISKDETFDIPAWKLNMMVVRMKSSGGLLLYAPVYVHKEVPQLLLSWLESLGTVKWLVVAAGSHSLCLPDVVKAFPKAKVIGPKVVEEKLRYAKVVDMFDYISTNKDDLKRANRELIKEGVELISVEGDVATNSLVCLVDQEVLLECDLVYGHKEWQTFEQWSGMEWTDRIFYLGLISKPNSPYGWLPSYRFWMMDPQSFGGLGYDQAAEDGSSCRDMAASLRNILGKQYNIAIGVHFNRMTREEFRNSIDAAWNWLDGKPLAAT